MVDDAALCCASTGASPPLLNEVVACATSRLAPHEVPKTIEIVDEVPRSAATTVNRGRLVEERGG